MNTEAEVHALKEEVSDLRKEVEALRTDIKGLVAAWETANHLVTFIKWIAGAAAAVMVLVTVARGRLDG